MRVSALIAALAACLPGKMAAADTYRFDMGGESSALAPGYTRVTGSTMLAKNPDYGWTRPPSAFIDRNDPTNPYYGTANTSPDFALYSDGVLSIEENSFEFKVKPGRYAVTAVIGDLSPGEGRPGNSLWANGTQVASNEMTNATVKAFLFPVEATEGSIFLRFRADSLQRYVTVIAVTADPLAEGETCALSVKELPEKLPTAETYRSNWGRYEDLLLADWEKAKTELKAEGVDFEFWRKESARLRQQKGYREYFGWGMGSWERLEERMGAISLQRICPVFTEMGVDGFLANSPIAIRELPKGGLRRAVAGHAEGFPQQDMTGITLNLMKKADGTTTTIPRVWSNCAPESLKAFQDLWRKTLTAGAPGASFFMIDEPRGMWYSGTIGDYSEPAQAAFKRWAAAHGWTDLAARGIPERGRTLDFYRFYQFRLESVAMFVKSSLKGTPVEKVPTAPGNGNVGPEQMNHNSYWPPAMVRHGLIAASWAYDSPASCKMYAETLRMAEEAGGQSCIVPPLYAEMHTPIQEVPMTTACVSALNTRVCPWHFSGPLNGPNRSQWMKSVYYGSRLAHATTGLAHTPAVYVWCPESIVYNDLVDFNQAEAGNWRKVWQTLFDANIDFGVTNLIAIPKGTVLLYACVRPVLNGEEFSRLRRFVETGGTVLCAFTGPPESPDGARIPNWDALPKDRVIRVELDPRRLKEAVTSRTRGGNWVAVNPSVKTYFYNRNGARVHLLNNTDHTVPATEIAPNGVKDLLTGKEIQQGSPVAILPGGYALVEERR